MIGTDLLEAGPEKRLLLKISHVYYDNGYRTVFQLWSGLLKANEEKLMLLSYFVLLTFFSEFGFSVLNRMKMMWTAEIQI